MFVVWDIKDSIDSVLVLYWYYIGTVLIRSKQDKAMRLSLWWLEK